MDEPERGGQTSGFRKLIRPVIGNFGFGDFALIEKRGRPRGLIGSAEDFENQHRENKVIQPRAQRPKVADRDLFNRCDDKQAFVAGRQNEIFGGVGDRRRCIGVSRKTIGRPERFKVIGSTRLVGLRHGDELQKEMRIARHEACGPILLGFAVLRG